jgi:hypothetical protein
MNHFSTGDASGYYSDALSIASGAHLLPLSDDLGPMILPR